MERCLALSSSRKKKKVFWLQLQVRIEDRRNAQGIHCAVKSKFIEPLSDAHYL